MHVRDGYFGKLLLVMVAICPVIIWLSAVGIASVTSSFPLFMQALGKAVALVGTTLYFFMPVLSMRHPLQEMVFGGLDKAYRLHAKAGKLSFILITLHPILLGAGRLLEGKSLSSIWSWLSLMILSGLGALVVMAGAIGGSIYIHLKHQKKIKIHRLLGWTIGLILLHALLANARLTHNSLLLVYMLSVAGLGVYAFLYRSVLHKFIALRYPYSVTQVAHLSGGITELALRPLARQLRYKPGQFVFISFESTVIDSEPHPFSIASAPQGDLLRFGIKDLGDDTAKISQLTPGTVAWLEGPYGTFSQKAKNKNQVWIAGGVGITPFLSMARSLTNDYEGRIVLFYAANRLEDSAFLQELIDISRYLPGIFSVSIVAQNISGFVTVDKIKDEIKSLNEFEYLLCGPPPMMKAVRRGLMNAHVPVTTIHSEEFSM